MKLLCYNMSVVGLCFPNLVTASLPPGAFHTLSVSWVVSMDRETESRNAFEEGKSPFSQLVTDNRLAVACALDMFPLLFVKGGKSLKYFVQKLHRRAVPSTVPIPVAQCNIKL